MALPGPDGSVIWAPYVKWDDAPVTMSADEAMAAIAGGVEGKSILEEAKQLLNELLAHGGMAAKDVKGAADAHMISLATLRRAKSAIGVKVSRDGFGPGSSVIWSLPSIGAQPPSKNGQNPHRCSSQKMSTYAGDDHLCVGQVDLEERAAILEYDAGLTPAEAEERAAEEFPELPEFLRRGVQ